MNLFVDEFVVALHGDLRTVSDDQKQQFALTAGLEESQLSRRRWLFFDHAKAGREVTLTRSGSGLNKNDSIPPEFHGRTTISDEDAAY
jgi:hypothetical protein